MNGQRMGAIVLIKKKTKNTVLIILSTQGHYIFTK